MHDAIEEWCGSGETSLLGGAARATSASVSIGAGVQVRNTILINVLGGRHALSHRVLAVVIDEGVAEVIYMADLIDVLSLILAVIWAVVSPPR